jgi:hypothetical protein
MLWDDFARVGSPTVSGPVARGLSLGGAGFPDALTTALMRACVHVDEAACPDDLPAAVQERKPDFLIATVAALGPDPETVLDRVLDGRGGGTCPAFLVCEERLVPESRPVSTRFSEFLGSGQDALGYFLMIRATLRRKRPQAMRDVTAYGRLALDQERFTLSLGDGAAPLNKLEFCVLGAMLDAPRMVWNKVFLNRVVFGPVELKPGRHFDAYMSRVRRAVRDKVGEDPIVSERGLGYALSPSVLGVPPIVPVEGGRERLDRS